MWNFLGSLLRNDIGLTENGKTDLTQTVKVFTTVATSITGVITVVVVAYAIYLAYKFFTANDEDKRKNAKAQLIYAIIGVVVLVAIMILIPVVTNAIKNGLEY